MNYNELIESHREFFEQEIPLVISEGYALEREYEKGHWKEWYLDDISLHINLHDDYHEWRQRYGEDDPTNMTTEDIHTYFVGKLIGYNTKEMDVSVIYMVNSVLEDLTEHCKIYLRPNGVWRVVD
jgi:hypothetical protein